jgi:hypothetical protein
MVTKSDYTKREVKASQSVLIELVHLLGEFKDSMVVVGGSVPPLLYPEYASEYVGTLDIDIALDHRTIMESYETISKYLQKKGYIVDDRQPFIFYRDISMPEGDTVRIQVDFLSGEYGGTGKSHRTQKVQDIKARKARGCDLAFTENIEVFIEGELPGGGKDRVKCKISGIVPYIVMKGITLANRLKEKDAWDIYYCLIHHPEGLDNLIKKFKPYINHGLVREGLNNIKEKFESPDHIGPQHVVDFMEISDEEEKERIKRDAFERVNYLLKGLGII